MQLTSEILTEAARRVETELNAVCEKPVFRNQVHLSTTSLRRIRFRIRIPTEVSTFGTEGLDVIKMTLSNDFLFDLWQHEIVGFTTVQKIKDLLVLDISDEKIQST